MNKVIGAIFGVLVAGVLGYFTYTLIDGNSKITDFNKYDYYSVIPATEDNGNIADHVKGSADAPVLVFEYADFQCPGCASLNPKVNKMIEALDGKVAVVYRNFLLSYHQNGTAAASAAEAAGLQGYWKEYADALFTYQSEWEYASPEDRTNYFKEYFIEVANGAGDIDKFLEDLGSKEVSKKISFDMGIGKRVDIGGTPAFYVDGQLIVWSKAGSFTHNGKTISWEDAHSTQEDFIQLFTDIANLMLAE